MTRPPSVVAVEQRGAARRRPVEQRGERAGALPRGDDDARAPASSAAARGAQLGPHAARRRRGARAPSVERRAVERATRPRRRARTPGVSLSSTSGARAERRRERGGDVVGVEVEQRAARRADAGEHRRAALTRAASRAGAASTARTAPTSPSARGVGDGARPRTMPPSSAAQPDRVDAARRAGARPAACSRARRAPRPRPRAWRRR